MHLLLISTPLSPQHSFPVEIYMWVLKPEQVKSHSTSLPHPHTHLPPILGAISFEVWVSVLAVSSEPLSASIIEKLMGQIQPRIFNSSCLPRSEGRKSPTMQCNTHSGPDPGRGKCRAQTLAVCLCL